MAKAPHSTTLEQLLATGKAKLGRSDLSFSAQTGSRMVVGLLAAGDDGGWLRDVCAEAAQSLLCVTAPKSADFSNPDLQALLAQFAHHDLCTLAKSISLCGKGTAGAAVFDLCAVFTGPILVVFDLPSEGKVPTKASLQSAARTCRAAYVFYDPFHDGQKARQKLFVGPHIHWLKCFGLQDDILRRFWRMKLVPTILPAALLDELSPAFFYHQIRSRKDYRFYRAGIEAALDACGRTSLQRRFRAAFRARIEANDPALQFAKLRDKAQGARPENPDVWAMAGRKPQDPLVQDWPSAPGNVWMLDRSPEALRYLSNRWQGVTIGYEERAGVTLAQTAPLALGMLSVGHGTQVERNPEERFPWHVIGPNLSGVMPVTGPVAEATLYCAYRHAAHAALPTVLAMGQAAAGATAADVDRGTPLYSALIADVAQGKAALETWGKTLFIDRMRLSLLSGSPQMSQAEASVHYAAVAAVFAQDLSEITEQDALPVFVVMQSAGTCSDGRSEVILAEGQFDLDSLTLPALVPSPTYPWPLMAGTPATPSAEATLVLDELSMLAVAAFQAGQKWFCPLMRSATLSGCQITVEFSTMAGLVLDEGPHGFHIMGTDNPPKISKAEVVGTDRVLLHLDADAAGGGLSLAYAWGHYTSENTADKTANHGSLRDTWEAPSRAISGQKLHRFALAARVQLAR